MFLAGEKCIYPLKEKLQIEIKCCKSSLYPLVQYKLKHKPKDVTFGSICLSSNLTHNLIDYLPHLLENLDQILMKAAIL